MPDISGPEIILERTVTQVTFVPPHARRVLTSPGWEVLVLIDAATAADREDWSPDLAAVSDILHGLPSSATRISVIFDRK